MKLTFDICNCKLGRDAYTNPDKLACGPMCIVSKGRRVASVFVLDQPFQPTRQLLAYPSRLKFIHPKSRTSRIHHFYKMLALQSSRKSADSTSFADCCTPNVLPCKIHHDGPVEMSQRYWKPVKDEKGNNIILLLLTVDSGANEVEQITITLPISAAGSCEAEEFSFRMATRVRNITFYMCMCSR